MENRLPITVKKEGLGVRAVQTIYEDREGRIWVEEEEGFIVLRRNLLNVTKKLPMGIKKNEN